MPREIQDKITELLANGFTLREIISTLQGLTLSDGDPAPVPSLAGLSRHAQKIKEMEQSSAQKMSRWVAASKMAKTWAEEIEKNPDGDVGQLNIQLLHGIASEVAMKFGEEEGIDLSDFSILARAVKDITSASKTNQERINTIRREFAKRATANLEKAANQNGGALSTEKLLEIMREQYGV